MDTASCRRPPLLPTVPDGARFSPTGVQPALPSHPTPRHHGHRRRGGRGCGPSRRGASSSGPAAVWLQTRPPLSQFLQILELAAADFLGVCSPGSPLAEGREASHGCQDMALKRPETTQTAHLGPGARWATRRGTDISRVGEEAWLEVGPQDSAGTPHRHC